MPSQWLVRNHPIALVVWVAAGVLLHGCGQPDTFGTGQTGYPGPTNIVAAYPIPLTRTITSHLLPTPLVDTNWPRPKSLIGASPAEVRRIAVNMMIQNGEVLSGTPQVRLARPVTLDELEQLGFGKFGWSACEAPALMLIIVHGDFQVNLLGGSSGPVHYVTYVFDLRAGGPMLTAPSRNGEGLRFVLNDPRLPTSMPSPTLPPDVPTLVPIAPAPSPSQCHHYGEIAPPAQPPTPQQ
jgi:hypothetical protein